MPKIDCIFPHLHELSYSICTKTPASPFCAEYIFPSLHQGLLLSAYFNDFRRLMSIMIFPQSVCFEIFPHPGAKCIGTPAGIIYRCKNLLSLLFSISLGFAGSQSNRNVLWRKSTACFSHPMHQNRTQKIVLTFIYIR